MLTFRVCEFYLNLKKKKKSFSLSPWRHLSEIGCSTCSWGLGWGDTKGLWKRQELTLLSVTGRSLLSLSFGVWAWGVDERNRRGQTCLAFPLSIRTGMILYLVNDLKCSARHRTYIWVGCERSLIQPQPCKTLQWEACGLSIHSVLPGLTLWASGNIPQDPRVLLWSWALSVSFLQVQPPGPSSEQEEKSGLVLSDRDLHGLARLVEGRRKWIFDLLLGTHLVKPLGRKRRMGGCLCLFPSPSAWWS